MVLSSTEFSLSFSRPFLCSHPYLATNSFLFSRSLLPYFQPTQFFPISKPPFPLLSLTPPLVLEILATAPAYQGKGAGRVLVDWGTSRAEKEGLPGYVESSPHGSFLYPKYGFKEVNRFSMMDGDYVELLMVREVGKGS